MTAGWEIRSIYEIADHCLGKMLDKSKNRGTLRPYLRNLNVRWFKFDLSDLLEMRFEDHERDRYTAKKGDLIVCEGGYPGRAAIWPHDEPVYLQKALHRVRFKEPATAQWFLYLLYFSEMNGSLRDHFTGVGIQHFTGEALRRFRLPLPPLSEQKRIVAILDEAFEASDAAIANTEKNLANARELFDSYLRGIFAHDSSHVAKAPRDHAGPTHRYTVPGVSVRVEETTRTGGRAATTRHIPGSFSLSVGMPEFKARKGWRWTALTDLARMESGHTPSRRHPEYWGGGVPWVGIRDAKRFHGTAITETEETTNNLGIANSSARLLPSGTVCLSRTASVGYVTVLDRPMATSQDFVNWVCSAELYPHFLKYLFMAQGNEIFKFSSGAVHQTIYFPEAKAFHICVPGLDQQIGIVTQLDSIKERSKHLEAIYRKKLEALSELKQAILRKAFAGELTARPEKALQEAAE